MDAGWAPAAFKVFRPERRLRGKGSRTGGLKPQVYDLGDFVFDFDFEPMTHTFHRPPHGQGASFA
jgi:hypothetical protein